MKAYIIEIEESDLTTKENLTQIVKALAKEGIKVKSAGIQSTTNISSCRKPE